MSAVTLRYTARTREGQPVTGALRVDSRPEAISRLRSRGLFITSLGDANGPRSRIAWLRSANLRRGDRLAAAIRSLAALVGSGVPLRRSLRCVTEQCADAVLQESFRGAAEELVGGASLSEAMRRRPGEFPDQLVALIAAGELGGTLDHALDRGAVLLEREASLRKQMTGALIYPAIVACSALGLVSFLLIATVPAFAGILTQLHASLPFSTRMMIATSALMRSPVTWLGAAFVAASVLSAVAALRRSVRVAELWDRAIGHVPLVGSLRRSAHVAYFARSLGTLLQCGVVITEAVGAAAAVAGTAGFRNAALDMRQRLRAGSPLTPLLAASGLFDSTAVEMAYVGEESGTLDAMLIRVAEHHETETSHMLRVVTAVLEPVMILALGGAVGTIVGSILIPLYGAIGSLR